MNRFARRQIRNVCLTLVVLLGIWAWVRAEHDALRHTAFTTGYLLLAAVTFLALYNIRKKLSFLPLGSSTTWMQWHIYVGWGTIGVFALHIGPKMPHGVLDTTLAVVYLLTAASGVIGLYFTHTIPAQLARVGEEVIFERIPSHRRQVGTQASQLVLDSVAASGSTTLADFYAARLFRFFEAARGWRYQLRPSTALRKSLMNEMQDLRRYLSDQEQTACERLFSLVRRKDDLDYQEARQRLLKSWLFVHIGLTCVLLLLAMVHGLVAHAFHGGVV